MREAVRLGQRVVLLSSRPGRVVGEWKVNIKGPRTIEHPAVGALAAEITLRLREEIASHAQLTELITIAAPERKGRRSCQLLMIR